MRPKRRFPTFAVLAALVWMAGSLLILGPGMASKNPNAPTWLDGGILLQVAGLALWWLHERRAGAG